MGIKLKRIIFFITAAILSLYLFLFVISLQRQFPRDKTLRGVAWFRFDQKNSLEGWEERIFKGKVLYSVKTDNNQGYLNAYSAKSASGIMRWIKFNPRLHPMISWKWRVTKFPEGQPGVYEDSGWVEKDDYAARFYIIFPKFPFFRLQCLEYVWDKNLPLGTVLVNPNFKNLKVIVAESGDKNLGKWVTVERNIAEDFRKFFGKNPGNAGAIAIMTDADNTASAAEAQYNDIEVGYEK